MDVQISETAVLNFKIPKYPEPGSIRYIVFTVLATLNSHIDLMALATKVPLSHEGIRSIKYIKKKENINVYRSVDEQPNSGKAFNNQATIIVHTNDNKPINTKIFRNGKLQMTGCRGVEDANDISDKLLSIFRALPSDVVQNPETLTITETTIAMINSIFFTNFELKRRELVNILDKYYSDDLISCNFEVNNYQGVNIKRRSSKGNTVTILVFRSGKTLITGGKCEEDIKEMYVFINNIFRKYYDDIVLVKFDAKFLM
jgi:TATA-box binding protein (TBP) (component of TFIID and TFIIIB)